MAQSPFYGYFGQMPTFQPSQPQSFAQPGVQQGSQNAQPQPSFSAPQLPPNLLGMMSGYYGGSPFNAYGGGQFNPFGAASFNPYGGGQFNPYGGGQFSPYGAASFNPYSGFQFNQYGGGQFNPYGGFPFNPQTDVKPQLLGLGNPSSQTAETASQQSLLGSTSNAPNALVQTGTAEEAAAAMQGKPVAQSNQRIVT